MIKSRTMQVEDKKLTDLTRKIVQQRDAGGKCIICGFQMYSNTEVCHYIKRRHIALTWDLVNCNLGHMACNRMEENSQKLRLRYRQRMIDIYGLDKVEQLERDKNKTFKMSISEKRELITKYKLILNES